VTIENMYSYSLIRFSWISKK